MESAHECHGAHAIRVVADLFTGSPGNSGQIGYEALVRWVQTPLNTMLLIATVLVMLYHSHLGIEVVFEDYVKQGWQRVAALALQKFLHLVLAIAGYSVLILYHLVAQNESRRVPVTPSATALVVPR